MNMRSEEYPHSKRSPHCFVSPLPCLRHPLMFRLQPGAPVFRRAINRFTSALRNGPLQTSSPTSPRIKFSSSSSLLPPPSRFRLLSSPAAG
eukprot:7102186-Pyramimonas_sp.AAC.1